MYHKNQNRSYSLQLLSGIWEKLASGNNANIKVRLIISQIGADYKAVNWVSHQFNTIFNSYDQKQAKVIILNEDFSYEILCIKAVKV